MTDVIHDPVTDWCACEPDSDRRCGYRILADKVVEEFNPPDRAEGLTDGTLRNHMDSR